MVGQHLRWIVIASASLAALLALPETAEAVLSGINGRIVFASGRDSADGFDGEAKLYLRPAFGGPGAGVASPTITPATGVQHRHPTWSPDRTKIAYARGTPGAPTAENFDIVVQDLTTGVATTVSTSPTLSSDRPAWSPDGTRIAWEEQPSLNSADRYIVVYNVAAGTTSNVTTAGAPIEGKPAWSADSQTLYYVVGDPAVANSMGIYYRSPVSSASTEQTWKNDTNVSEFQPSISPDGTRICFTMGSGFNSGAEVMFATLANPGGTLALTSGGGGNYNCTWSPDGTRIAYVNGIFTNGALVAENSDNTGNLLVLEDNPLNFDGNPDWAPDGRPDCENVAIDVNVNASASIPLRCPDTGPAYEQTDVTVDLPDDAGPTNGTLGTIQPGDPPTVTYTPNANFRGADSFQFRARDGVAFATERGNVRINVVVPQPTPGAADTVRPKVTNVRVSPRRWRRGRTLPRISKAPVGTTIRWRLSEDARATLTFQRAVSGRRVGRRCLAPTPGLSKRRRCTRFRKAGSLTVGKAKAGLNRVRFQGRLTRSRRLRLGRYRVGVRGRDAAGNRSRTRYSAKFQIVAP
jgi:hypothetical protein